MKVQNKVIVVTGAGGGIGGELVFELLKRGATVAAVDLRKDSLDAIAKKAGVQPDKLSLHSLDISKQSAVEALPKAVLAAHGNVDGIINCAGIIQPFVKVNDLDYATIERVMGVNFYGTLYMTKVFLPHLLNRPIAHVINVSSMGGFLPVPGQGVYGASKAAVKLLTEALYAELLNTPVRVTAVFPGATATNIAENSHVTAPKAAADNPDLKAQSLTATAAARLIVNGIEKDKPQIFTGKDSNFMNKLYRLNPVYATQFIAKKMSSLLS